MAPALTLYDWLTELCNRYLNEKVRIKWHIVAFGIVGNLNLNLINNIVKFIKLSRIFKLQNLSFASRVLDGLDETDWSRLVSFLSLFDGPATACSTCDRLTIAPTRWSGTRSVKCVNLKHKPFQFIWKSCANRSRYLHQICTPSETLSPLGNSHAVVLLRLRVSIVIIHLGLHCTI